MELKMARCAECDCDCEGENFYIGNYYALLCKDCYEKETAADQINQKPGYHLRNIEKGELGEASKIREECDEFMDAVEQGVAVMALVELSDLLGAISEYLKKHHPSMTMEDLHKMREVTERAFRNGRR